MRKILTAIFILSSLYTIGQGKKTIMVVFPHPDDESAMGEVLAKYADSGYRVRLFIATDGKDGTRVTNIPAGDSLGMLRKEETRCACRILGIEEPVFLGIERLDTKIGVGKYFGEHKRFRDTLKVLIPQVDPDLIITFGPDGDTHHAEHIVTGSAVTEVLLAEGWVERYPLYYLAWDHHLGQTFNLGYVHESYMNVKINYEQRYEDIALSIMPCYQTQFTTQEIMEDRSKKLEDKGNYTYFRRFSVTKGLQHKF